MYTHLMALFLGLPGCAGIRKVKPIWILLKQETLSGSGIGWAICKSAPRSRQITTPARHHSVFFTGRMPFLSPNQQRQSTEGTTTPIPHHLMFTGRMFFLMPNQQCQSTKDTMGGGGIANKMSMVRYVSVCV